MPENSKFRGFTFGFGDDGLTKDDLSKMREDIANYRYRAELSRHLISSKPVVEPKFDAADRRIAELEAELKIRRLQEARMHVEISSLRVQNHQLQVSLLAVQSRAPKAQESIDKSMLRRLIQLCHPDKHGASEASRNATDWLLRQKDRS